MQLQGVVPDVFTCNALISTCQKGEQPEHASEIFEAMQLQCVAPNVITCAALISICAKGLALVSLCRPIMFACDRTLS